MIRFAAVFILGLAIAFGQKQQPDKGAERARPAQKSESAVSAIPAGAAEISPGLFKHTDEAGKTWLYRKTPFGIVKSVDALAAAPATEPAADQRGNPFGDMKAATGAASRPSATFVEQGDTYKFERSTPFGPTRWTRKKSELTADEQEIVNRSSAQKNAATGTKE